MLVSVQDGVPVPKVIDFGVAKAINQKLVEETFFTEHGVLIGTPEYMSPEQAELNGLDVDTTSDIYSLGILLYELLVGVLPFDPKVLRKAGYEEMRRIIREAETPRPTARLESLGAEASEIAARHRTTPEGLKRQLRGELHWITLKAMEKDRSRRYPSVAELAADIVRHLEDRPVQARPPSQFYLWSKFVRRHKVAVSGGLVVACSLLAGIVVATWQASVADFRRREAEWQSYVANLRAAEGLIESNETEQARQILLTCPPRLRDWEWKHLFLQTDSSLVTLHDFAPQPANANFAPPSRNTLTNLPPATLLKLVERYGPSRPNVSLSVAFNRQKNAIVLLGLYPNRVQSWDLQSYRPSSYYDGLDWIHAISSDGTKVIVSPLFTGASDDGLGVFDLISRRLIARAERKNPRYQPTANILSAVFSPDGNRAVALTETSTNESSGRITRDRKLIVWETNSGRILATMDGSHIGSSLVFSPDGTRILSGGEIGPDFWTGFPTTDVRRADLVEEQLIGASLKPALRLEDGNLAQSMVFSLDGKRIAAALADGARVWDGTTGRPLLTFRDGHVVDCIAYSPDSRKIVAATSDRVVRIRNAITGAITGTLRGHDGRVGAATFTPDGKRIFTVQTHPPAIKVWDADSCCAVNTLAGHEKVVRLAVFSPDQRFLASASDDSTVRLWNIATGKEIRVLRGHRTGVGAVAFSPDGTLLASGADDGTILIWDVSSGKAILFIAEQPGPHRYLLPENRGVTSLAFNRDGTQLMFGSRDRTVRIWDVRLRSQLKEIQVGDVVNSVAIGRNGQILSSSGAGLSLPTVTSPTGRLYYGSPEIPLTAPAVTVWDASTGEAAVHMAQIARNAEAVSAEYSPDGLRIIGVLTDGTAAIWQSATGKMITTIRYASTGIQAAVFHPGGTRIFTVSGDAIQVWDARSFQMIVALHGPDATMPFLAFSRDGSTMASGSQDGTLHVWKTGPASQQ